MARHIKWGDSPPLHVRLYIEQIFEPDAPWLTRCSFEHEPAEFWMKDRRRIVVTPTTISISQPEILASPY